MLRRIFLIAVILLAAQNSFAARSFFNRGADLYVPQPRLISPVTEVVNLAGQDKLIFKWSTVEGNTFKRSYYDFRLYKGYDMLESTLILKKQVPPLQGELTLDASIFENCQIYTWSLRQKYISAKSEKSWQSFKVIK